MRVSPVQLLQLSFRRINVEIDFENYEPSEDEFQSDFEGVPLKTAVTFDSLDEENPHGQLFFVTLRAKVENKKKEAAEGQRFAPYTIDIEAGAKLLLFSGAEALGNAKDLVVVNGASLLWSAIREQVAVLTARMPAGLAMLPTVNFGDLRKAKAPPSNEKGVKTGKAKTKSTVPTRVKNRSTPVER